jgi:ribokinase
VRIAVIGHVEHVTIARVAALPSPGEIAHLDSPLVVAGGGGGIAFAQLAKSDAEIHLFTAFGNDDAGREVERHVRGTRAHMHAALRDEPHTRDLVLVTPDGQRTIVVIGEPLHPRRTDDLPWDVLAACDAAYFTGQDPETIVAARAAKLLVVTARRREALLRSGVRADVVVGSAYDTREASVLADYPQPPRALVMTEHERGGYVETAEGIVRFAAAPAPESIAGTYGAGDTFAGALTWYMARGLPVIDACGRAAVHAAAVLGDVDPVLVQVRLT